MQVPGRRRTACRGANAGDGASSVTSLKRRDFLTLLGGVAAMPLAAQAQQPGLPVIAYLNQQSPDIAAAGLRTLRKGMSEAGYVEGRDFATEIRAAGGQYDRLPELVADLIRRRVSVIVTAGVPATTAAKRATTTIPIVFQMGADPVAFGLVASLNRPGGNVTGVATLGVGLGPKHLELLHELVPAARMMALLVNPSNPSSQAVTGELAAAARALGLQLQVVEARTERDLDGTFAAFHQLGAGGLVISNEGLFNNSGEELAALALRYRVPAIHVADDFVVAGGLVSYGASPAERGRLLALYIGRILKGEKPADLPVQQVTKIELTINLKTAKALGIEVPPALLIRADEVIE